MKESLSTQDLIQISSYLDEKLSPEIKAKVETRAVKDPFFLSSIEELRYTRRLLRSLPQRRAPRNFTLSPAMAGQTRPSRLQPLFGFTSAVAAVLTIIIFAGSRLLPGLFAANTAMAPEAALSAAPADAGTRSATDATAIPPLILWNGVPYGQAPALGMGGGGGGFGGGDGSGLTGIGGGGGAGAGGGGGVVYPTPTEPAVTAEELAKADPNSLILGIAPPAEQGQKVVTDMTAPAAASPVRETPRSPLTTANILEIIFGSLAVISAGLALIFRRRL